VSSSLKTSRKSVALMWSIGLMIGPIAGTWLFARNEALLWTSCLVLGEISTLLVMRGFERDQSVRE
jgi:hypothetical protein